MTFEPEVEQSVRYLRSDAARDALAADAYWPKWHSPWWHMLLLHEMGLTSEIPDAAVASHLEALARIPLKIFPIRPEDAPPGFDASRGSPCHCQLGNVYRVLAARGVDVDVELPWIREWLLAYQMPDGGLNCDEQAYLAQGECPSSMVGTIAAIEAFLHHAPRPWAPDVARFLERGARFLIGRECRLGSTTRHNADERVSAKAWPQLCFPRFYLYDVLRGLDALTLWAELAGQPLPPSSIDAAVADLTERFPDGAVRIGRRSYEGARTLAQTAPGVWERRQEAQTFPLLDAVSRVGDVSPFLTRQWRDVQQRAR